MYPYLEQEKLLLEGLETCRRLWNLALGQKKYLWKTGRVSVSVAEQMRCLTIEKRTNPFLSNMYDHVVQDVLKRLNRAFQLFFRKRGRYPKFKRNGSYNSITYPDSYNGSVRLGVARKNTKIYLSKIGYVPIVVHKDPPSGKNKRCTIKREANRWYAILEYESPDIDFTIEKISNPVGIDLGLIHAVVTSGNDVFDASKPLKKHEKRLKRLYQSVSRKKKGSNNRRKAVKKLAVEHHKISDIRRDWNHKTSRKIVDSYNFFVLEDLDIQQMLEKKERSKSISDVAWGQLRNYVAYKAERAGKRLVLVPPEYTSQICSNCKNIGNILLSERTYSCPVCGVIIDRDINAARNILERGMSRIGRDTVDFKPVESGVQYGQTTVRAQPFYEAGTTFRGG